MFTTFGLVVFIYRTCFCKSIGGSRETPAYYFVYFCKNYDCSYYKREFREYKEFRV